MKAISILIWAGFFLCASQLQAQDILGYITSKKEYKKTRKHLAEQAEVLEGLRVHSIGIELADRSWSMIIRYPELTHLPAKKASRRANRSLARSGTPEFEFVRQMLEDQLAYIVPASSIRTPDLVCDFEILYMDKQFLSVRFDREIKNDSASIEKNSTFKSLNLASGRSIDLDDLLTKDYEFQLINLIESQQNGDGSVIRDRMTPESIDNFDFSFCNEGITIQLPNDGFQHTLPLSALQLLVDPKGPLGKSK